MRLADHRLGGRHRAAGEVVQIADRGAAQVDGAATARPRWRSAARKATTSAALAGRQGSAWRAHQAHQAATPAR